MTDYDHEIAEIAQAYDLDAVWLTAQVLVESDGRTDAFRYEPDYHRRYLAGKPEWAGQIARRISSSYGLLQIMHPTAHDLGYRLEPEALFVPRTGLLWGARYLRSLLDWSAGDLAQALAAYNGGKGGNAHAPFRNQAYVTRVTQRHATLVASS